MISFIKTLFSANPPKKEGSDDKNNNDNNNNNGSSNNSTHNNDKYLCNFNKPEDFSDKEKEDDSTNQICSTNNNRVSISIGNDNSTKNTQIKKHVADSCSIVPSLLSAEQTRKQEMIQTNAREQEIDQRNAFATGTTAAWFLGPKAKELHS